MRFISWNVNGLRAIMNKGFTEAFWNLDADFFCLQETKLQAGQLELDLPGYEAYWSYAEKKGYSGTAILTRRPPLDVTSGIGIGEHDTEGRIVTLEYEDFYLVCVYTPNAQDELRRLDYRMAANHRYIVCTGGTAAVTVTQRSVFVCSGSASVTAGEIAPVAFTDVKAGSWYYDAVSYLAGIGLLGGVSATSFAPNGTLTLAQALTLAASLHQYSQDGKVTLKADKDIWYMSYVEYAVSQGVADGSYAGKTTAEYNAPVTRAEFVHILYGALPEESYTVINSIGYDAIPDVRASQAYADEIYAFYRAGIITGGEGNKFDPSGTITRSAVAVIMANMLDPGQRQSVTLK